MLVDFRERGREEGERNIYVQEKHHLVVSHIQAGD